MYPEATIKLHSPKNLCHDKVDLANKVNSKFDKRYMQTCEAMNRGMLLDPSFIGLTKRPPMKMRHPRKRKWA
jgi:hypothetical protein